MSETDITTESGDFLITETTVLNLITDSQAGGGRGGKVSIRQLGGSVHPHTAGNLVSPRPRD
jgi:hypothetical protein